MSYSRRIIGGNICGLLAYRRLKYVRFVGGETADRAAYKLPERRRLAVFPEAERRGNFAGKKRISALRIVGIFLAVIAYGSC